MKTISFSQLDMYQKCPKMRYWKYIEGIVPNGGGGGAKDMGTAIHSALEVLFKTGDICQSETKLNEYSPLSGSLNERDFAAVKAMFQGYVRKWGIPSNNYSIIAVERDFNIPIPSSNYVFTGRIDVLARSKDTGRIQLWDHKTATRIDYNYIMKRWMDLQLNLYAIAAKEVLGLTIDDYMYDVLEKPGIKIKKAETADQFYNRLVEDCGPDKYNRIVFASEAMRVEETKRQLCGWLAHMEIDDITGFHGENTNRCFECYGGTCEYWPLCSSGGSELVRDCGYHAKSAT